MTYPEAAIASLLDSADSSTIADFPTESGHTIADGIHDVPIAPAAAAISDVNFGTLL
jgi:hypothetical protein